MKRLGLMLLVPLAVACATPGTRTAVGAGAGGATGAVVGGALAGWKGALVGGTIGAVTGGAAGNILDRQAAELKRAHAQTERTAEGILVKLKDDLLFSTDSAELKAGAAQELASLGDILAKYPQDRIQVKGFADSTGTVPHNEALSQRRAETVRAALVERGVKPGTLLAIGRGESEPLATNATAAGRAKNRRVELHIANAG